MNWLDDMEAADPASPDPDADPWADLRQHAGEAERATLSQQPPASPIAHFIADREAFSTWARHQRETWLTHWSAGRSVTPGCSPEPGELEAGQ